MDQDRHIAAHRGRRVAEAGGAHLSSFEIERALAVAYEPANPTPQELRAAYAAGRAAGAARRPFTAAEYSLAPVLRHRRHVSPPARRPRVPRPRGAGRPARRRAGSSSRTSSCDPGDDGEPERSSPRLYLVRTTPPRATLSYGRVSAAQRGADAEPVAS
jgi:hypothetical protein